MTVAEPLVAAADGSCLGNPGPVGWAWYIDENCWAAGGYPSGTNNMGELKAVIDLFESSAHMAERPLYVLCDSQYVVNTVTKWMPGWKEKGWRKANGKLVHNLELIQALDKALEGRTYIFKWVKGHAGVRLNERADELARAVSTAIRDGEEPETGPGMVPASGQSKSGTRTSDQQQTTLDEDREGQTNGDDSEISREEELETLALELESLPVRKRTDLIETEALLTDDLVWITATGRRVGRTTVLEYRERAFADMTVPQIVRVEELGDSALLICARVENAREEVMRTSIWVKAAGWQLHFRQETAC